MSRNSAASAAGVSRVLLLSAILYAALTQGAFYSHQAIIFWPIVLLAGTVALVASLARKRRWPCPEAVWALPVLATTTISGVVSGHLSAAVPALVTIVAVVSALCVAALSAESERRWLIVGLVGVGVVVSITAIVGAVQRHEPWGRLVNGLWRGSSSLTYSNAAAGLIVPLLLVMIARLTLDGRHHLDLLAAHVLALGAIATLSRGGAAALFVGSGILVFTIGFAPIARATYPVLAGLIISGAAVLSVASADVSRSPAWTWVGVTLGMTITLAVGTRREHAVRVVAVSLPLLLAMTMGLIVVDAARGSEFSWTERITPTDDFRAGEWRAAWSQFETRPLIGVGPGQAQYRFVVDGQPFTAEFAHQEYLEVAAEQGLIGVVAVVTPLAIAVLWLATLWRRHHDLAVAGVLAALVAFLVHSGLDFLWHIPVLPVLVAALLGTALPSRTLHD